MNPDKADALLGITSDDDDDTPVTTTTEIVVAETYSPPAASTHSIEQVDETINFAKENMVKAIETMLDVVQDAALLAKQTGIADQYSSVSSLFATFIQANKALVDMETKQHSIHRKENQEAMFGAESGGTVNNTQINNHFHGTTEEFLEQFRKLQQNGAPTI